MKISLFIKISSPVVICSCYSGSRSSLPWYSSCMVVWVVTCVPLSLYFLKFPLKFLFRFWKYYVNFSISYYFCFLMMFNYKFCSYILCLLLPSSIQGLVDTFLHIPMVFFFFINSLIII